MAFTLPDLPYSYDALAPYMSRETLEYHHDKHHKAYVDNGNKLLARHRVGEQVARRDREGLFRQESRPLQQCRPALQPHPFLEVDEAEWRRQQASRRSGESRSFRPRLGRQDSGEDFAQAGVTQFGSGWAWLALKDGKLAIMKTRQRREPAGPGRHADRSACDVWEHSYYIDYRNRRPDYLKAFVDHLVNWDYVAEVYEKAAK